MAELTEETGITQQLSRRLLPLAIWIWLIIALLSPASYWFIQHRDLQRHASAYAVNLGEKFRDFALEAPLLWKYQTYNFLGLIERFHPTLEVEGFRVLDENGEQISGYTYRGEGLGPSGPLTLFEELRLTRGTAPILFNNRRVGTVEFFASDGELLRATALFMAISSLVGTFLALLVYRYPTGVAKRLEKRLKSATEFSRTVMESITDAVCIVDAGDFRVLGANAAFLRQTDHPESEFEGRHCYELTHGRVEPCGPPDEPCPLQTTVTTGEQSVVEHHHVLESGKKVFAEVTTSPVFDENGRVVRVVHVSRDISERKRAEEILAEYARKQEKLALIDELTGLHNRRGFLTLAAHQLRTSDRLGQSVHLLFADLDGMKWINDNLGHGMGDQALQEAAELLRATFREADLLARLGGDEFAVLAMNGNSGGGEVIARRFAEKIASFNRREGRSYRLSISIGVASYDPASPCSIEELLERGDALMYEQKQTMKRRENQTSSYRAVDP